MHYSRVFSQIPKTYYAFYIMAWFDILSYHTGYDGIRGELPETRGGGVITWLAWAMASRAKKGKNIYLLSLFAW